MSDERARQAIREALDDTLIVEAAAGTGKTTALVERIVRTLATGRATMVRIVAVTFTEKAAGELKLRLREALEGERTKAVDETTRRHLEQALATLEEAHVNTIHGFCADLLRERPVEARVDPLFSVLTEQGAAHVYNRAFTAWLQEALQQPSEGLRRALRRTSTPFQPVVPQGNRSGDGSIERLRAAGRALAEWRDFPEPWRRPPFDRSGEIDRLVQALHDLAASTSHPASTRDNLHADTDAVRRLSRQIALEQSFGRSDYDGWEGRLIDLLRDRGFAHTRNGGGHRYGPAVARTDVLAARDRLFNDLQQFRRAADADLAACLQQELAGATSQYEQLKERGGMLDFADLLVRARNLLRDNPAVRAHLQRSFDRLFVDEFQDTDPVQAEILLLLTSDDPGVSEWTKVRPAPGKLFIVGDPKQAIYRFRGTDVATYWRVSRHLERHGGRVLQLTTSYRSVPDLQRFVNAAFDPLMHANEALLQAQYVPLGPHRPPDDSQPAVIALPVPEPYPTRGRRKASAKAIEESLPDAVGAFIAWLIDEKNGWQVSEPGSDGTERRVPCRPRHIAVLFRRFASYGRDVTRRYTDAIEARGIPHLLVGGKAFHDREEVETVRAALAAIEWPDDELSIFATLKGPLFAIEDAALLEFRHRFGVLHPFRVPPALGGNSGYDLLLTAERTSHLVPIGDALRLLQRLHRGRNYRPVADTLGRLLAETRAHVGFVLRPAGEQALANVLYVAELARQYEAGGGISFRGFIDKLREAVETDAGEAPILEDSSDGVRLMTVHKAKGLEFPVVILADLTCRLSRDDASRYVDLERRLSAMKIGGWAPYDVLDHEAEEAARDQAEGIRLAYVAATRARDLLVVPALGDEPWEGGWFGPLNSALYPPLQSRRESSRGPKVPPFRSKDSVLARPEAEPAGPATVAPGLHVFAERGYGVVWWDPHALALGLTPPYGVRREDLIVKDVPRSVVADGRGTYEQWKMSRLETTTAGATPSRVVMTARDWAGIEPRPAEAPSGERAETVSVRGGPLPERERPGGPAFGLLVHAVLAQVPLDANRATLEQVARLESRMLGMPPREAEAAASLVEAVLAHELLVRARAAAARGACRRETPVSLVTPEGTEVEGVVDLAFEDQGEWVVIDYKTDRELAADTQGTYQRQVALYAAAIARATGLPARPVLLRV